MNFKRQFSGIDYWLIAAVCTLSIFGIICIGSATQINQGASYSQFLLQIVWFVIGLGLMSAMLFVDYNAYSQFYIAIYIINIILLIAVFFFAKETNGAKRWIRWGPVGIQPSEFSKLFMIFCIAKLIDIKKEYLNELPTLFLISLFAAVPVLLIILQPSLSASLVSIAIFLIILFVAGLSFKIMAIGLGIVVPTVGFVLWDVSRESPLLLNKILDDYQFGRIQTFIDPTSNPDTYYQTMKSINALGAGRLSGKGLFEGTLNQLSYLPESHNDFIFSVIGEEFGFMGCMFVLGLLLFIIFRCILIAMSTRDLFSQLIAAGVAGMYAFQTFVNVCVTTGMMPNTGMPLPFVGYGGSSMWMNMLAIGLVLNIGMRRSKSLFEGV